jgi:D-alanine-D-alanine ligase
MVLSLTLHKGMTKHVIKDLGIRTPDFFVVQGEDDISAINLPYPLFAKPVAEGTGKGITPQSKISSAKELASVCGHLLAMYRQPVLVETFLPGREFTVGIVGTGAEAVSVGVMEILLNAKAEKEIYSYENKVNYEDLVNYALVTGEWAKKAESVALSAWRGLSCRDAGRVDVRADKNGDMHFLEVNPLAGLHPVHSDLPIICAMNHISFSELIRRILEHAAKRISRA